MINKEQLDSKLDSVRDSVDLQNDKIDSIADFLYKEVKKLNKNINSLKINLGDTYGMDSKKRK